MDSNVFHLLDAFFLPNSPSIYRWRILGGYFKVEESRWQKFPRRAAGHTGRPRVPGGRACRAAGQAGRPLDLVGFQLTFFGRLRSCPDGGYLVGFHRNLCFVVGRSCGPHGLATLGGQPRPSGGLGWVPTPSRSPHDFSQLGHSWNLFP